MGIMTENRHKIIGLILISIFYIVTGVMAKTSPLIILGNILTIVAILAYSGNTVISTWMFFISELCYIGVAKKLEQNMVIYNIPYTELTILMVGALVGTVILVRKYRKRDIVPVESYKDKLSNILRIKHKPIKLKPVFRIMIYSLLVATAMGIAASMEVVGNTDFTMLSSLWITAPTFYILAVALHISDAYILGMIKQVVYIVIAYMSIVTGGNNYVYIASNIIIMSSLIVGYIDFRANERKEI